MHVIIDACGADSLADWALLRLELWPEGSLEEHLAFAEEALGEPDRLVAFLARDGRGAVLGFAEASLRIDYVNGASKSPVGFLEGLYVREAARRCGIARGLVSAVERWAVEHGCVELASDADLGNVASHRTHDALGFAETERVVYFLKRIDLPSA